MSKKILPFPLVMKNGAKVRSIEELRKNADVESIMSHYMKGTLTRWCKAFHYDDIITETDNITEQIIRKLYETLGIDVNEDELKQYFDDDTGSQTEGVDVIEETEIIDSEDIKIKLKEFDDSIDYNEYAIAVNAVENDDSSGKKYKVSIMNNKMKTTCHCFIKCDNDKHINESILNMIRNMSSIAEKKEQKNDYESTDDSFVRSNDFVFVKGNNNVSDFYICDHPVTVSEYDSIMSKKPKKFSDYNCEMQYTTRTDAKKYCNMRSEKEGLTPCYIGSGKKLQCNFEANGYRLVTEDEWLIIGGNEHLGGRSGLAGRTVGSIVVGSIAGTHNSYHVKQDLPNKLGIYDIGIDEHIDGEISSGMFGVGELSKGFRVVRSAK